MEFTFKIAQQHAQDWIAHYGYGAVVPSLLIDPAGVPWAWIFLMLLAGEAGKSVPLMLAFGFLTVSAFDHALYWAGVLGGRPLLRKLGQRWPKPAQHIERAEAFVLRRGLLAIVGGRFLPLVGRYVALGAGLSALPYACFIVYDLVGAGVTSVGFGLAAHLIGRKTINQPGFATTVGWLVIIGIILALGFTAAQICWACRKNCETEDALDVPAPDKAIL